MSASESKVLYPMAKRRKPSNDTDFLPPLSGTYEGKKEGKTKANLELKLDIDRIRLFSPVLDIVSGSIVKSKGNLPSLEKEKGLYFRSIRGTVKVNREVELAANNETEISCDLIVTRSDGEKLAGKFFFLLLLPQDDGTWEGNVKLEIEKENITFEGVSRISSFFRQFALDIDYVEQVVWPTIALSSFDDVPEKMKSRKLDPRIAFEDAGVKLVYDEENNNKVEDPTPHNPWTKNEMYDVMMANFDYIDDASDRIWCMIAKNPPDERFMGYSFEQNDLHGFALFTGHKSFQGLLEPSSEGFIHASRRFLHYFVHECGHGLGLVHPFEIGRSNDLTWMNYAWKYDVENGPGEFYHDFAYTFSNTELSVIRHSPNNAFKAVTSHPVQVSNYGIVKSLSSGKLLEDDGRSESEDDNLLSLRIKVRPEPYAVGELIEVEVRIRNEGEAPVMVERNLSVESGNLVVYVTNPDGTIKRASSILRRIAASAHYDPLLLHPHGGEEGSDRYSQLITVGEGNAGPCFCEDGEYTLQAVYTGGKYKVRSNFEKCVVTMSSTDDETNKKTMNTAFLLGSVNQHRLSGAANEWKRIATLALEDKKLQVNKLISVVHDLNKNEVRCSSGKVEGQSKQEAKAIEVKPLQLTDLEFLDGTKDLVQYYKQQGIKSDNMQYKELIVARAKILLKTDPNEATSEFNQLIADLVSRGLKYSALKSVSDEWNRLNQPEEKSNKKSAEFLQARVEEILDWYPTKSLDGKPDMSGIGHGTLLSHFRDDHVAATSKISLLLFNKLDETNDLNDVLDYADNLQRGYQVNHQVLQWAVEIFIIHSKLAKQSGIEYPLPKESDQLKLASTAAMTITQRTGTPDESWMNYWRMDADLNYHHRHWHSVYVVGREIGFNVDWFGRWRRERPELERQGELFAYMHSQMLARYDAERVSWGLPPVQAWQYNHTDPEGFNAGFEFHNDPRNANVAPRPGASWPTQQRQVFFQWERNYLNAVDSGVLPSINVAGQPQQLSFPMDFNLSGHVLEASSSAWQRTLGSIHNQGHGVFGTNRVPGGGSYMLSTVTAMRDPIFYRWHKHIDNLWHRWNDTQIVELAEDAPPVIIRSNDIIMSRSEQPPPTFDSFSNEDFTSDEIQTYLDPPQKKFEWDNKKSHDPFYYHIRFRRAAGGDLNLTFRIFICPASQITNRKMWIEMDKFVYRLASNEETATINRPDRHSSVIKRIPREMQGNVETNTTNMVTGFCECGWPYNMLLPRGTAEGEEYRLCVFISDNNLDNIGVRSSCGSLSFCGASGQQYPDRRPMGYPFTTAVAIRGDEVSIPGAISSLSNAAMSSFLIKNNISTSPPAPMIDMWSPWTQLQQDDGTNANSSEVTVYRPSRLIGRMRVLIDDQAMNLSNQTGRLSVRFQGRGNENGSYRVGSATIAIRDRTTLNVARGSRVAVITVNGQTAFDVPSNGVISDEVEMSRGGGDLFVTFTLESPGSFLQGDRGQFTSTWVIFDPSGEAATSQNWDSLVDADIRISSSIYCVGGIMVPLPQ